MERLSIYLSIWCVCCFADRLFVDTCGGVMRTSYRDNARTIAQLLFRVAHCATFWDRNLRNAVQQQQRSGCIAPRCATSGSRKLRSAQLSFCDSEVVEHNNASGAKLRSLWAVALLHHARTVIYWVLISGFVCGCVLCLTPMMFYVVKICFLWAHRGHRDW